MGSSCEQNRALLYERSLFSVSGARILETVDAHDLAGRVPSDKHKESRTIATLRRIFHAVSETAYVMFADMAVNL